MLSRVKDWVAKSLGESTFEKLAREIAGSELQSILLEVMHARAAERTPADILAQYRRDRFVTPAQVDQRESVAIDGHLLAAAEGFRAIELSPVTPLGTSSEFGASDQHRVLSALRTTEVVSDPTNVLALECASRMRSEPGPLHFATSQRVVRAQPVPKLPGYAQHFRIFVLASGGIETKDHAFTVDTLVHHIRTQLAAFDRLEQHGYAFGKRRVDVLATAERAALADRVAAAVGGERKLLEHAYYSGGIRYMLWVTAPDGREIPLGDGGTFDWLAKLSSNRRAVYVASGMGAQLVAAVFKR
jgi:hypothetical protein